MRYSTGPYWILAAMLGVILLPYGFLRMFPRVLLRPLLDTVAERFEPPSSGDLVPPLPNEFLFITAWDAGDRIVRNSSSLIPDLTRCAFDESLDSWRRYYCLRALAGRAALGPELRAQIKAQLWRLAGVESDTDRPKIFATQLLVDSFFDEPDVQDFIIAKFEQTNDLGMRDMYMNMFIDRNCRRAIPAVKRLMRSKEKPVRRNLGYHFLGSLADKDAFEALVDLLPSEGDPLARRWLFMAMASTRDPRAKEYLVPRLANRWKDTSSEAIHDYWGTLRAFGRLGDASMIPILEAEFSKPLRADDRRRLEKAISDIRNGGTPGRGIHTW